MNVSQWPPPKEWRKLVHLPHLEDRVNSSAASLHYALGDRQPGTQYSIDELRPEDLAEHAFPRPFILYVLLPSVELGGSLETFQISYDSRPQWQHVDPRELQVVPIVWWRGVYYRIVVGHGGFLPLRQKMFCSNCSRWFNISNFRHKLGCWRCKICRKTFSKVNQEHPCTAKEVVDMHDLGRLYYRFPKKNQPDPRWRTAPVRDNIIFADMETFSNPMTTNMQVYAVGARIINAPAGEVRLWYGKNALNDFIEWLWSLQGHYTVYFWNGSAFDVPLLLMRCIQRSELPEVDGTIKKNNRLVTLRFDTGYKCSITLRDGYLMCPESLATACKAFGVPADIAKSDFDHSRVYSWATAEEHRQEVLRYLKNDVLSLEWVVAEFGQQMYNLFKLDIADFVTLPHLASNAWRMVARPMINKRLLIPTFAEDQEFRPGLRGGSVIPQAREWVSSYGVDAAFADALKDGLIFLDCNSLYPTVMANFRYPATTYDIMRHGVDGDDLSRLHEEFDAYDTLPTPRQFQIYHGIFEVDVTCPQHHVSTFLPSRGEDGAICHDLLPKLRQVYCGCELLHAVKLGYVVRRVYKMLSYRVGSGHDLHARFPHMFKEYVERNIRIREEFPKGTPQNTIAKLMNNSVYGKFCQEMIQKDWTVADVDVDLEGPDVVRDGAHHAIVDESGHSIAAIVERKKAKPMNTNSVFIGMAILAQSRVWMSAALDEIDGYTKISRTFFYKDTDSMLLHTAAVQAMPRHRLGDGLGQFKNDLGEGIVVAYYALAPKTYCVVVVMPDGSHWLKVRVKGIPHTSALIKVNREELQNPHDASLAAQVEVIEKSRRQAGISPPVSPHFRAYVSIFKAVGDAPARRIVSKYLSHHTFKDSLDDKLESVMVHFGSFRQDFGKRAATGMGITPEHRRRSLWKTFWWSKGKRAFQETDAEEGPLPAFSYPLGHAFGGQDAL